MSFFGRKVRRRRLPIVAFAGTLMAWQALTLIGAVPASAAVACTFSGGTVSITMSAGGDTVFIDQDEDGRIRTDDGGGATDCGVALTSNTTTINVTGGAGVQEVTISMYDDTGATVDWGTINWSVALGADDDLLIVDNSGGDDSVDVVGGASGIDLNNDANLDVSHSGIEEFELLGGPEDDSISAGGSTATGAAMSGYDSLFIFGDAGEDTLTGGADEDEIDGGADDDTIAGGLGDDELFGGAGSDTVDYSGSTSAVVVDLTASTATGQGLDTLPSGGVTDFENIIGSPQGDTLTGVAGDDNTITPGAGDDKVDCNGADADDMVDFSDAAAGVTVDLDAGTATGDGSDTITDCVDVQGSDNDDTITGDDEDNDLFGGAGNDSISGGSADDDSDIIDGESGNDWVDYSDREDSVTVDLTLATSGATAGACNDAVEFDNGEVEDGEEDCIVRVENAALGTGDDTFVGNAFNNEVKPGGGQNSLTGGTGGDTLDYRDYEAGVTVDLAGGGAGDDAIDGFENVRGTGFADSIIGSDGSNTIRGRGGNDRVRAGGGDDTVRGGAGNDVLRGGGGDDDLFGGKGNDVLRGGGGSDFCKGGPGKDSVKGCESGKA